MLEASESFNCQRCGTTLPTRESICLGCETSERHDVTSKSGHAGSLPMGVTIAMLTFPFWGIALFAWLTKALGIPRVFDLIAVLAILSPIPIVLSNRLGVVAKVALVFVYYWLAVPIAVFTLIAVIGQA